MGLIDTVDIVLPILSLLSLHIIKSMQLGNIFILLI